MSQVTYTHPYLYQFTYRTSAEVLNVPWRVAEAAPVFTASYSEGREELTVSPLSLHSSKCFFTKPEPKYFQNSRKFLPSFTAANATNAPTIAITTSNSTSVKPALARRDTRRTPLARNEMAHFMATVPIVLSVETWCTSCGRKQVSD